MDTDVVNIVTWNPPTYPRYRLLHQRLESFARQGWPVGLMQTPQMPAEAVFFTRGEGT